MPRVPNAEGFGVRSKAVLSVAFLTAIAMVAGCAGGSVSPRVQTGRADVNAVGDGGSITTSEWTYGLPTAGVNWVDHQGNLHDSGRPECLAAGTSTDIQFAAVEVQVGGTTWRPVVWISCP